MPYPIFDRQRIRVKPLAERKHDMSVSDIMLPDTEPPTISPVRMESLKNLATRIKQARQLNKQVIISYGAHLIKNGLGPILNELIKDGWVTTLCTNGAGTIHDWELAYFGKSTENVRRYVGEGQFGIWDETGRYMNLAILLGAAENKGFGESLGEMIEIDKLLIPSHFSLKDELARELRNDSFDNDTFGARAELLAFLKTHHLNAGAIDLQHAYKEFSVLRTAFTHRVPLCVLPGIGYDIIFTHPLMNGAALGKAADRDFLTFANSQLDLDGGVYISIGSAIMSPMTFEKARSMARNIARQENRSLDNTFIVVNDMQPAGDDWKIEPGKESPAYYLRFLKTFRRMHGEFEYIELDNREFLLNLMNLLK